MFSLQQLKREFLEYTEIEKGRSLHTVSNYEHYLDRFLQFLKDDNPKAVTEQAVREFRMFLNRQMIGRGKKRPEDILPMKKKNQNYYLIALRAFLKYLAKRGIPALSAECIELAKVGERSLDLISSEELKRLRSAPDTTSLSGLRDK